MYCNASTTAPHALPPEEGTGPGAQAITAAASGPDGSSALLLVSISPDRVRMTASLVMGNGSQTVARSWHRRGKGTWESRDPEFIDAEERLGVELAEWLDAIDLPTRVANMLPRPGTPAAAAAIAEAAEEVRRA